MFQKTGKIKIAERYFNKLKTLKTVQRNVRKNAKFKKNVHANLLKNYDIKKFRIFFLKLKI